jgi:hypothetical protein
MNYYSLDEIHHIFVEVVDGRGRHGDFLKKYAAAFLQADDENALLLKVSALMLIKKYHLDAYLDNYQPEKLGEDAWIRQKAAKEDGAIVSAGHMTKEEKKNG